MSADELEWIKVHQAGSRGKSFIKPGKVRLMSTERKDVLVTRIGDDIYAYDTKCPHNGFSLKDVLPEKDCSITCPLHRYAFDLRTGKNLSGEGFYLENYPIQFRNDGMYIGFPKRSRFLGIF